MRNRLPKLFYVVLLAEMLALPSAVQESIQIALQWRAMNRLR